MIQEARRKIIMNKGGFTSTMNLSLSMSAAVSVLSLQKTAESAMLIIKGSVASSFSNSVAKTLSSGSGSLEEGGLGSSPDSDGDGGSTLQYHICNSTILKTR